MLFPAVRMLKQATEIIHRQQKLIVDLRDQNDRLMAEKNASEVAYMRIGRDLIEQFLISLDMPENQDVIRDRLTTSLGFYRDEIAVREEHVR